MNLSNEEIVAIIAHRGITGEDAWTAVTHWRVNPWSADTIRVQRCLEAHPRT